MRSVDNIIVSTELKVREAFILLNKSGLLILLVVNNDGSLKRTVTDGDLRRLILETESLDSTLGALRDVKPIVSSESATRSEVSALMYLHGINHVPVLDVTGCPIGIHVRDDIDNRILLSEPHMSGEELAFVNQAFETNWIAPLGPNVDALSGQF